MLAPKPAQQKAANVDRSGRLLFPVGDQQLCLRGSRLVNTDWVYGCVVYTGYNTKMMLNRNAPRFKRSSFEHQLNRFVAFIFVVNFAALPPAEHQLHGAQPGLRQRICRSGDTSSLGWLLNFLTQYILLSAS